MPPYFKACISGPSASGKTFVAKKLASYAKAKFVSTSSLLVNSGLLLGHQACLSHEQQHFWLSNDADVFNAQRKQDTSFDRTVDLLVYRMSSEPRDLVIDSLVLPFLL